MLKGPESTKVMQSARATLGGGESHSLLFPRTRLTCAQPSGTSSSDDFPGRARSWKHEHRLHAFSDVRPLYPVSTPFFPTDGPRLPYRTRIFDLDVAKTLLIMSALVYERSDEKVMEAANLAATNLAQAEKVLLDSESVIRTHVSASSSLGSSR
jgi:hypothetical protein